MTVNIIVKNAVVNVQTDVNTGTSRVTAANTQEGIEAIARVKDRLSSEFFQRPFFDPQKPYEVSISSLAERGGGRGKKRDAYPELVVPAIEQLAIEECYDMTAARMQQEPKPAPDSLEHQRHQHLQGFMRSTAVQGGLFTPDSRDLPMRQQLLAQLKLSNRRGEISL